MFDRLRRDRAVVPRGPQFDKDFFEGIERGMAERDTAAEQSAGAGGRASQAWRARQGRSVRSHGTRIPNDTAAAVRAGAEQGDAAGRNHGRPRCRQDQHRGAAGGNHPAHGAFQSAHRTAREPAPMATAPTTRTNPRRTMTTTGEVIGTRARPVAGPHGARRSRTIGRAEPQHVKKGRAAVWQARLTVGRSGSRARTTTTKAAKAVASST